MNKYLESEPGINFMQYSTSELHRLLTNNSNIGYNAENLTVVVLSCNRVESTLKLVESLQDKCNGFSGEILIMDNGSTEESLKTLKSGLSKISIRYKIIENGKNLGVAKGRNLSLKYVNTKWVMFLDNDIYFVKDIFKDVQKSIAQIGCKFINIPLLNNDEKTLFSYGGHIYLSLLGNSIHVGCGSTYKQVNVENLGYNEECLGTFLFGGSCIVEKKTFLNCGGFDENMFIGFEDIDFSIKLFNEGYKIGCCKAIGLVHNHVKSEIKDNIEYEKKRFSSEELYKSAQYFKLKHKLDVWSKSTEEWLEQREKELGIKGKIEEKIEIKEKKTKIAIIVDTRNWAYDNIANNICKYLKSRYDFKIIYMDEIPDSNIIYLLYACNDCDIIHFLWRGIINYLYSDYTRYYLSYYGRGYDSFKAEILDNLCITCSVYDHKYLNSGKYITENILSNVKGYTVSSKKLLDIYNNLELKKPNCEITDGVDLKKFYPINIDRFLNIGNRELIIGWVGNSEWNGNSKKDYKGINTIIKPAIDELKKEGYKIKLQTIDKQNKMVPHDKMVEFYSDLDLYICASINEGTPNPVLEAMACGVPIISTNVGIVTEALGEKQKKYILEVRSKECLKEKIKLFIRNINEINEISNENLNQIKLWSWETKCKEFDRFFQNILSEVKDEKNRH